MNVSDINWAALYEPFDPEYVDFRAINTPKPHNGKNSALVAAYVDARAVQNRLDEIVGPENWSFVPQVAATKDGAVTAAIGILTICGVAKGDIGDCDQRERNKTSVSDSLKRAAVMWGIGRYLYNFKRKYANFEQRGGDWYLVDGEEERLRKLLPRPRSAPVTSSLQPPQQTATQSNAEASKDRPALKQTILAIQDLQRKLGHDVDSELSLVQLTEEALARMGRDLQAELKQQEATPV